MARNGETHWAKVRRELGQKPIVERRIGGAAPLYVERYLYRTVEVTVSGIGCTGLVTQFGGGSVSEGEKSRVRHPHLVPTQSLLIPPGVPTHWRYSGTVDYAVFYLLEGESRLLQDLDALARASPEPMAFTDALVGVAARQLIDEMQKGPAADEGFIERLAAIMLEQAYRALTTPASGGINPRHVHYSRLQAVLNHVHSRPADDLSAAALAARAGVSPGYFRRVFVDATGMPPHRYVLAARLERARKLLTLSEMPIPRIAQDCGFASQSHFTARFREAHAVTPAQFRSLAGRGRERAAARTRASPAGR